MFPRWRLSVAGLPLVERYLPISQNDVVESCPDMQEYSRSSSSEYVLREKIPVFAQKLSFWTFARKWLPWLLCCCLLISNVRSYINLRSLIFDDAVYCELLNCIPAGTPGVANQSLSAPVDIAAYGWKNINFDAATQDELTEYQGVPNEKNNKLWTDSFNLCKCDYERVYNSLYLFHKSVSPRLAWKKRGRSKIERYRWMMKDTTLSHSTCSINYTVWSVSQCLPYLHQSFADGITLRINCARRFTGTLPAMASQNTLISIWFISTIASINYGRVLCVPWM